MVSGWHEKYYYVSEYLSKELIGAKVLSIKGGFENKYHAEIKFNNGITLHFFEDSEGSEIDVSREGGIK